MTSGSDLTALLAGMTPRLRPGRFVFATVPDGRAVPGAVVTVAEDEGTTVVVPDAAAGGLDAEYPCAWITLEVRSSLAAVGFLAAVTRALADAGISANPVSGFHHDHLFVPWDRREEALAVLEALADSGRSNRHRSSGTPRPRVSSGGGQGKLARVSDSGTLDVPPTVFVLFGASGDLAARLVLPAFYRLAQEQLLPKSWLLIGSGRRRLSDDDFRDHVHGVLGEFGPKPEDGPWEDFASRLRFAGDGFSADDAGQLVHRVAEAEDELGGGDRSSVQRVHYLGVPPTAFEPITNALGAHDLAERSRVVYEKPFGTSLEAFRTLDKAVHRVFDEPAIYRIDHFLGKEASQQLRALRFANGLFWSSWDRHHVASVQIDVPEVLDVADRAEFYDATGAVLDMLVTHLFQLAAEIAMEPPASLAADEIAQARADAVKAFRPLVSDDIVRAQFEGYRDISEVADDSNTETFVAARMWIDTDRWRDVPFLMRTGKRMAESHQKVSLVMRDPEGGPYRASTESEGGAAIPVRGNVLRFDLAGDGALSISMNIEIPGSQSALKTQCTEILLHDVDGGDPLPPYVRLIHDILLGDRALFTRPDGLEEVWHAAGAALDGSTPLYSYAPGSWGPTEALHLADPVGWELGDQVE